MAERLTKEEREKLKRLDQEASPAPWKCWNGWGPHTDGLMRVLRIGPMSSASTGLWVNDGGDIVGTEEDIELAARARDAAPRLLAELEAAEMTIERIRKYVAECSSQSAAKAVAFAWISAELGQEEK